MGSGQALVSVVIPTRDAGPRFAETLRAIRAQEVPGGVDLWVVDSGSADDTVALARAHGAHILTVAPEAFGHGRTRNLALAACGGRYVALTVQDAIPADDRWLAALVEALEAHPQAAGAYSRHLPHPGASVVARQAAEYWHARLGGPHEQALGDPEAFRRLRIDEKQYRCTFNNVSSIVRREVWEAQPFPEVAYAEDLAWGYAVLRAGHTLLYEPASRVYHSHDRPPAYVLRRAYVEAQAVGGIFGEPPRPLAPPQAEALLGLFEAAGRDPEGEGTCGGDPRTGYETLFTGRGHGRRIAYLFGEGSPLPEEERRWLHEQLLYCFARQGGASGQPLPDRFRQRFPYPRDYIRSLEWRLEAVARNGGSHWLSGAEVRALFAFLWDDLGRDYVRLAVLHDGGPVDEVALARLQIAERLEEWLAIATAQEPGNGAEDALQFRAHAAALVVGRRLGQAAIGTHHDAWDARLRAIWTGGI
ncbi:MAG: glycosyltransferase [Chloroflexi bacterium]|nr:glycosyltransferase [Chloroflexota bacterium]